MNDKTASVAFIFHIGETINLFRQFFGISTGVKHYIGQIDKGEHYDYSRELIERGYQRLKSL